MSAILYTEQSQLEFRTPTTVFFGEYVVEVVEAPPPALLFMQPLIAVKQPLPLLRSYVKSFAAYADPLPSLDVLFQRPLAAQAKPGVLLSSIKYFPPYADPVAPPLDVLFARPLQAFVQPTPVRVFQRHYSPYADPVGAPLNILFQRPARSIVQPKLEFRTPVIQFFGEYVVEVPVVPPLPDLFLQRPFRAVQQPVALEQRRQVSHQFFGEYVVPVVPGIEVNLVRFQARAIEPYRRLAPVHYLGLTETPHIDVVLNLEERRLQARVQPVPKYRPTQPMYWLFPENPPVSILLQQRPLRGILQSIPKITPTKVLTVPFPDPAPVIAGNVFVVIPNTPGATEVYVVISNSTKIRTTIDDTKPKVIMVSNPAALPVEVII